MKVLEGIDQSRVKQLENFLSWGIDQEESIFGKYWSVELEGLEALSPELAQYFWAESALLLCLAGPSNAPDLEALAITKHVLEHLGEYLACFDRAHYVRWEPHSIVVPYQAKPYIWDLVFISEYGAGISYAFTGTSTDSFALHRKATGDRDISDVEGIAVAVLDTLKGVKNRSTALEQFLERIDTQKITARQALPELRALLLQNKSQLDNFEHFMALVQSVYQFSENQQSG